MIVTKVTSQLVDVTPATYIVMWPGHRSVCERQIWQQPSKCDQPDDFSVCDCECGKATSKVMVNATRPPQFGLGYLDECG